ncbi:MAG TPA: methionyl-tRNA formyltransferase, partial [candidate division WOR-3 bacterium]|nr:methionyl-tRNA formyltransferase [candidate division WOR-3 bacterium]
VLDPPDCNDPAFVARLAELKPELGVLVAHGSILRPPLLAVPARGFINLHPSLLPCWRGAAPIQRALMAGADETGVTIIRMNERVDAGDILAREAHPVGPEETFGELAARLAEAGARLLLDTIDRLTREEVAGLPQNPSRACPAPRIRTEDRRLDWSRPARQLHDHVRALSPHPGAVAGFRGRRLLILRSRIVPDAPADDTPAGTFLLDRPGLAVRTGDGALELIELRPEGGRLQPGRDFRNGARLVPGERLT